MYMAELSMEQRLNMNKQHIVQLLATSRMLGTVRGAVRLSRRFRALGAAHPSTIADKSRGGSSTSLRRLMSQGCAARTGACSYQQARKRQPMDASPPAASTPELSSKLG